MVRRFRSHLNPCCARATPSQIRDLHDLLDDGISIFTGGCQPAHPESERDWLVETEVHLRYSDQLKNIILDIITALGFVVDEDELLDPYKDVWENYQQETIQKFSDSKHAEKILNDVHLPGKKDAEYKDLETPEEKAWAFNDMLFAYQQKHQCLIYDEYGKCIRYGFPTLDNVFAFTGFECNDMLEDVKEKYFAKLRKEKEALQNG